MKKVCIGSEDEKDVHGRISGGPAACGGAVCRDQRQHVPQAGLSVLRQPGGAEPEYPGQQAAADPDKAARP